MPLADVFPAPSGRLTNKAGLSAEAHVPVFERHLLAKAVDSLAARPVDSLSAAETIALVVGLDYLKARSTFRTAGVQVETTKRQLAEQDVPVIISAR